MGPAANSGRASRHRSRPAGTVRFCHDCFARNTGHGFFTDFTVDRNAAKPVVCERVIGHLWAKVEGMENIMNFLLFLEDGFACMLEGAGIDDDVSDIDFSQAKISPVVQDH